MSRVIYTIDSGANGCILMHQAGVNRLIKPKDFSPQSIIEGSIMVIEQLNTFSPKQEGANYKQVALKYRRMKSLWEHGAYLKGAFEAKGCSVIELHPNKWQSPYKRIMKLYSWEKLDTKNGLKKVSEFLYPEEKVTLWNCDALLILDYYLKTYRPNL